MNNTKIINKVDCLGMGIMPLDFLFEISKYPKAGSKIDGESLTIQGGGPVPNVLVGLSRFGFSTSLITAIGKDYAGQVGLDEIKNEGVDCHHIIAKKNSISAMASGFVEQGTGRRTLVLAREIAVLPRDLKLSSLPIPKIIHLDGRDLEATIKLAKWGKRVGATICFDIGSVRNDVSPVFPYIDHLVVADEYAFPFTREKRTKKAIEKLKRFCNGTIVITEGIKGAMGMECGENFYQPAFKVKNIDTTGAGDAFHTGYIYGLLKDFSLQERMKFGAAVAALKCTEKGARAGIPRLAEVKKFLKGDSKYYA